MNGLLGSGPHLLAAQFWILDPIYSAMGTVLAWLYAIVPSYGLAIALLTVAVRVLLIPLTTKQVKSQQAMQRIQPELKRLQAKYKDDRAKLNEEMMKFYKENKINPVAGCLPLLLQTPLFLVLYRLILGLTHKPTPKHLPASSELYRSLVHSGGKMVSWGIDLAQSASAQKGLAHAFPFYVLIAITIASGFYQQRQMTARMPEGSSNAQMKMIGRVFPVMIGLISFRIPAGVVVYFIISNIWQIVQQEITFRTLGPPPGATPASKVDKTGTKGGGGSGSRSGSGKSPAGGRPNGSNNNSSNKNNNTNNKAAPKKGEPNRAQGGKAGGRQQPSSKQQPSSSKQQPAKGKRPPPSPRPKGLPEPGARNGQKDPSAKNTPPRKDI